MAESVRIESVTPELAQQYLGQMRANRNKRHQRIASYSGTMARGHWVLTHQGIAFDTDGELFDGQHRLEAQVKAGATITMFVFRGISKEAIKYVDRGLPRSARDALALAGIGDFSNDLLSVARYFRVFPTRGGFRADIAIDTLVATLEEFSEPIYFACDALKSPGIPGITKAMRTLIARARNVGEDEDRLQEFCTSLKTGIVSRNEDDLAVITLRNMLMRTTGHSGASIEADRYRKGQTALKAYLSRIAATKLYGTEADLFPIASDDDGNGL